MVNISGDPVWAEDIGRLDLNTADLGIPPQLLMEAAGLQAANVLYDEFNLSEKTKIVIFAGRGNNGGDGFVIARHLATRGVPVSVYLLGKPSDIRTKEAKLNWDILQKLRLNVKARAIADSQDMEQLYRSGEFNDASLIIDALLGTGIRGKVRDPFATAIKIINRFKNKIPIIAVDVPSGVDPNTGTVPDLGVDCDFRVTFHRDKVGLNKITDPQKVVVLPIGTPIEAHLFVGKGDLIRALKYRGASVHKGQFGKVLIIGGSKNYSGAPSLAAMAAQFMGMDLVVVFAPKSVASVIRGYGPDLIVISGEGDNLTEKDLDLLKPWIEWADSIVLGPGIGRSDETSRFIEALLYYYRDLTDGASDAHKAPAMVIDADAIKISSRIFKEHGDLRAIGKNLVFTPHLGELSGMIDVSEIPPADDFEGRSSFLVERLNDFIADAVYLVKGPYDYIVSPNASPFSWRVNLTGCPEMSVGGTGDILSGIVASFLAMNNEPFLSACVGAYLNGRIGEYTKSKYGRRIRATDILNEIRPYLISMGL